MNILITQNAKLHHSTGFMSCERLLYMFQMREHKMSTTRMRMYSSYVALCFLCLTLFFIPFPFFCPCFQFLPSLFLTFFPLFSHFLCLPSFLFFCLGFFLSFSLSFFILLSSFICIADTSTLFCVSSFFLLVHTSFLGFICLCAAVECMVVLTAIIVSCSWYFGYARWWAWGETTIYCCDPISFDSRFRRRQGVSSVTLTRRCSAIMEAECGSKSSKVNISRYP